MTNSAHHNDSRRVDDWLTLEGAEVAIVQDGRTLAEGFVDAVTQDGTVLWLLESTGRRRLFEKCEFYEAWVPSEHAGLNYKINRSVV